ncbi:MAG TPA: hypothetical protein VM009_03365 [Terriglobales bacterium]|nr:hypothetical protein [Terriglobales bacterium]
MRNVGISIVGALLLWGCSGAPEKPADKSQGTATKAEPAKAESEYETGRAAFQKMYVAARNWSADAQPVRLESHPTKEDPKDGRAAMWAAVFVSASKQNLRNFSWSGVATDPDKGIQPGSLDYYSPSNASTRPFDLNFLKVDSTRAFEVADKKGGAALWKANPQQPIKYMLFFDSSKARLVWRVQYGNSQNDAKLRVLVNASSGDFIATEK